MPNLRPTEDVHTTTDGTSKPAPEHVLTFPLGTAVPTKKNERIFCERFEAKSAERGFFEIFRGIDQKKGSMGSDGKIITPQLINLRLQLQSRQQRERSTIHSMQR